MSATDLASEGTCKHDPNGAIIGRADSPLSTTVACVGNEPESPNSTFTEVIQDHIQNHSQSSRTLGVAEEEQENVCCSHCNGVRREYVETKVQPRSKLHSTHRVWQQYIDHIRQPGNGESTYWHFKICIAKDHNCSPYSRDSCARGQYGPIQSHLHNLLQPVVDWNILQYAHLRMVECVLDRVQLFNTSLKHPMYKAAVCNLFNLAADTALIHALLRHGTHAMSRATGFTALSTTYTEQLIRFKEPDGYDMTEANGNQEVLLGIKKAQNGGYSKEPPIRIRATESEVASASRQSASMAERLFLHYDHVRQFVARHEATMQRVWTGKSKKQRRTLLQRAANLNPDGLWDSSKLPIGHRPEILISMNDCSKIPQDPLDVPTFAVPHLNLDDLCDGNNLLLFIKSRGRSFPGVFASQDLSNCGIITRQIRHRKLPRRVENPNACKNTPEPQFSKVPGYYMQLAQATTPQEYAKLHCENDLSAIGGVDVDVGLCILKIQLFNYSFLHRVCLILLDTSGLLRLGNVWEQQSLWLDDSRFPEQPEPRGCKLAEPLSSVPRMLMAASYKVPTKIDLDFLESLVSARVREAREDLRSMRSDPSFFRDTINAESDHSPLHLENQDRRVSPDVADGTGSKFYWMRVLETVIRNMHLDLALWSGILNHLVRLKELWPSGRSATDQPLALRPELHKVFCQLGGLLRIATDYAAKEMALASFSCYRSIWNIHVHIGECDDLFLDRRFDSECPGVKLAGAFMSMAKEPAGERHASDWVIADYMQGLIQDDPVESKFVTDLLARRFNDWALMGEVDRQLNGLHYWAQSIQEGAFLFSYNLVHDLEVLHRFNKLAYGAAQEVAESNFLRHDRFNHPSDATRTKSSVRKRREAESQLQEFWAKVDEYCAESFVSIEEMLGIKIMDNVVPMNTAPWTEAEEMASQPAATPGTAVDLQDLEFKARLTIHDTVRVVPKIKAKTHGEGKPVQLVSTPRQRAGQDNAGPPDGSIRLGKKAYRTLTALFHSAEQQAQHPREIVWGDFAYAMVAAGFEVQQLWGSAWHFRPIDPNMGRSIQFHEPHPSHKLDLNLCRHFGRRLHRAFGWKFETFARKSGNELA